MAEIVSVIWKGDIKKWVDDIAQKQIPFATAKALTQTTSRIGEIVASEASANMNIRKAWAGRYKTAKFGAGPSAANAFASTPALSKTPLSKMSSTVGTIGWQMAEQMDRGETIRKPIKAKQRYIPLQVGRGKAQNPKSMLSKKDVFIKNTSKGLIMFQRKRRNIKPLYKIVQKQTIKPAFDFMAIVEMKAATSFQYFFPKAMEDAIKTAKFK